MRKHLSIYSCFGPLTEAWTPRWSRTVTTFTNPGDWILVEERTYPSALANAHPWGIKAIPVAIDGEGLCPANLHLEKSPQLRNATWSYDRLAVLAINYTSILAFLSGFRWDLSGPLSP